jgi:hypothetical protein
MSPAMLGCEPFRLRDLLGNDRRVERDVGVAFDRPGRVRDIVVRETRVNRDLPALAVLVELPEGVGVRRERPPRKVEDLRENFLDAEASEERRRRLEQAAQPRDLLGGCLLSIAESAFDVLGRQRNPPRVRAKLA